VRRRIVGLRANASTRSHAELDEGDPIDLDARHVAAIVSAWTAD
jgi:hypothetical protein